MVSPSRSRRTLLAAIAVVAAALASPPTARGDIISPGTRFLDDSQLTLSVGEFDPYCEHQRVVKAGDTLDAIAREVYGDAARVADLLAANRGVEPKKLAIGAVLLLPAKQAPPAEGGPHAWQLFEVGGLGPIGEAERCYPGRSGHVSNRPMSWLAVPAEHAAEFAEWRHAHAKEYLSKELIASVPWLVATDALHLPRAVRDDSPVHRMQSTLTLEAVKPAPISGKRHQLVVRSEGFDAEGKPVASGTIGAGNAGGAGGEALFGGGARAVTLLALAALGARLLLLRRRRAQLAEA